MKGGLAKSKNSGFTIIEVLIVLAVTLVLFFIATLFLNGRQAKTEFSQSIYAMQTQIEQSIGNVIDGNYPSENNFTCYPDDSNGYPTLGYSASPQGTNLGCLYLGSILQLAPTSLNSYIIIANQYDTSGNTINNIYQSGAAPRVPGIINPQENNYEFGIKAYCMQYLTSTAPNPNDPCSGGTNIGGIAITVDTASTSSSPKADIIPINNTSINVPDPIDFEDKVDIPATAPPDNIEASFGDSNPKYGVQMCFNSIDGSGGTESAYIQIGGINGSDGVSVVIMDKSDCME